MEAKDFKRREDHNEDLLAPSNLGDLSLGRANDLHGLFLSKVLQGQITGFKLHQTRLSTLIRRDNSGGSTNLRPLPGRYWAASEEKRSPNHSPSRRKRA
jgi:hypothetical protein